MAFKTTIKPALLPYPLLQYTLRDSQLATAHPAFAALTPKVLRARVRDGCLVQGRDFIVVGFGPRAPRFWHLEQLLKTLSGTK
jgi:hypothetical protein